MVISPCRLALYDRLTLESCVGLIGSTGRAGSGHWSIADWLWPSALFTRVAGAMKVTAAKSSLPRRDLLFSVPISTCTRSRGKRTPCILRLGSNFSRYVLQCLLHATDK